MPRDTTPLFVVGMPRTGTTLLERILGNHPQIKTCGELNDFRQQMQWTKRGAHLLLQTRTRALDGTLRPLFERWYPGLDNDNGRGANQAVAA